MSEISLRRSNAPVQTCCCHVRQWVSSRQYGGGATITIRRVWHCSYNMAASRDECSILSSYRKLRTEKQVPIIYYTCVPAITRIPVYTIWMIEVCARVRVSQRRKKQTNENLKTVRNKVYVSLYEKSLGRRGEKNSQNVQEI